MPDAVLQPNNSVKLLFCDVFFWYRKTQFYTILTDNKLTSNLEKCSKRNGRPSFIVLKVKEIHNFTQF